MKEIYASKRSMDNFHLCLRNSILLGWPVKFYFVFSMVSNSKSEIKHIQCNAMSLFYRKISLSLSKTKKG